MYEIIIQPHNNRFHCNRDQTLLEAARAQGAYLPPLGCGGGACGMCKMRLLSGEVDGGDESSFALSSEEREEGIILFCAAIPLSDLELAPLDEEE